MVRAAALTPEPVAIVIRLYLARGWRTDLPRLILLLQAGNAVSFVGYGFAVIVVAVIAAAALHRYRALKHASDDLSLLGERVSEEARHNSANGPAEMR